TGFRKRIDKPAYTFEHHAERFTVGTGCVHVIVKPFLSFILRINTVPRLAIPFSEIKCPDPSVDNHVAENLPGQRYTAFQRAAVDACKPDTFQFRLYGGQLFGESIGQGYIGISVANSWGYIYAGMSYQIKFHRLN